MTLSSVLDRILADAREESGEIRARGQEEAERILREAQKEAEKLRRSLVLKGEQDLRREIGKRLSNRRLEARKRALALKKELLGELIRSLPARLQDRPSGEYADLLAGLVGDDLAGEPARLEVGEKDVEVFGPGFSGLVAERLKKRFPGWGLTASESPGPFDMGLIVSTGRVVHNLALPVLLAEKRERMEMQLSPALFAE